MHRSALDHHVCHGNLLNTDGASRGNPGLATAGGVLRDGEGRWRGGFAINIGRCSAPLAELWGVYYRLYMAWENRCTRVVLEVDSALVVGFLQTGIPCLSWYVCAMA
ncbi:unnamed protein product [Microthlaspi erraticum]|uniref:RNase H type-1 domain-containing protein n=1 Tax=Microthlaspi erraticum TaxID=1685480 RepID=A0A6D2J9Q5_9BRAS|nr:unnamed protein product [Microthlaspi erraticum]